MIELIPILPSHYEDLYRICCDNMAYMQQLLPSLWHFQLNAAKYEGFTLMDGDKVVGAITFSDLIPLRDACMNIDVRQDYWYKWGTRQNFRTVCDFTFNKLQLPRMSSRTIKNLTCHSEPMLIKAGFRVEGIIEDALFYPDGFHDIVLYGMLRRRCRWL